MIRFIKEEEISSEQAKYKEKYPWAAEPYWPGVLVVVDNTTGQIVGRAEIQSRVLVGMLDADSPAAVHETIAAVDGWLAGRNVSQYEFIVPNGNERFQKAIEKHYGYAQQEVSPSKIFFVKRDK